MGRVSEHDARLRRERGSDARELETHAIGRVSKRMEDARLELPRGRS
jgi:hypothetical protein